MSFRKLSIILYTFVLPFLLAQNCVCDKSDFLYDHKLVPEFVKIDDVEPNPSEIDQEIFAFAKITYSDLSKHQRVSPSRNLSLLSHQTGANSPIRAPPL